MRAFCRSVEESGGLAARLYGSSIVATVAASFSHEIERTPPAGHGDVANMGETRMTDLSGKVIIVTGAAGNLGGCMAGLLSARGARLVLSDIDRIGVERCRDEIREQGGDAVSHMTDVTQEEQVRDLMAFAAKEVGGIDILVNNAGLLGQEHQVQLEDLETALWDRTMDVNLKSVFLASKCAIPHLIERGGGAIINISSASSLIGYLMTTAYATSKGGINVLTRYVATQYGKDNIRCNAVLPGIHLSEEAIARTPRESLDQLAEHCMLPRLGTPEDVAKLVAFLASDDASYITAQLLQVDGGLLDHAPQMAEARRNGGFYRSRLERS
jgi:NAD(P)-dependent dehydrogenase (short-subunit alcohol dehydrogenase family)